MRLETALGATVISNLLIHHSDWRIVQHHLGSQGNLARNFHQEISGSRPSTQSCVNLVQRIPALVMEFATDTTRIIRLGP